ncbi:MAG: hypothetical protein ACRDMX_06990 [Solirubrobacteraceae bacterium]
MTTGLSLAALAAFALGGSVIASAKSSHRTARASAPALTASAQPDSVDGAGTPAVDIDGPGGPNVQQGPSAQSGDQSAPDTGATSADSASSEPSDSTGPASGEADGPGGYQDPPGANVDTQQQGQH